MEFQPDPGKDQHCDREQSEEGDGGHILSSLTSSLRRKMSSAQKE